MVETKDHGFVITGRLSKVKDLVVFKVDQNGGISSPCGNAFDRESIPSASFPLLHSKAHINVRDVSDPIVDQPLAPVTFEGIASECD